MDKQNSKYRWVVFSSVLFSYFLIVSQRTAPGLITDQLMKDFHVTASTIGFLTSLQFFAYAALQIPIGILSDRFGPNIFLIIGTLLNGVGTVIYSLAPNEAFLFFGRLMAGMGDATIWINLVLILSQWFKAKEFVGLLGVAGMVGSLGSLLATVPFSAWISLAGWRMPFFIVGLILCIFGLFLYYVLVRKPKEFFPGYTAIKKPSAKIAQKRENTIMLLRRIFSERQAWATFLCHFGLVGTYVGFIGSWAVPYGMNIYGMSRSGASQLVMFGLFGALAGAPLTGWISGRMGSIRKPYLTVHILIFICWMAFFLLNGKPAFFLLFALFFVIGYGNGASSLTFAAVRNYFPMKEVGVVSGFANTGGFLSAVLLPVVFGKVLDNFQPASSLAGYHYGFIIPVIFTMLGIIGGIFLKEGSKEAAESSRLGG